MSETKPLDDDGINALIDTRSAIRADLRGKTNGQYVRFETMLESLLAEETEHIAGDTSGPTVRNLACVIAVFENGGNADESDVNALIAEHTKTELWDRLHTVLIDIGLADDDGEPLFNADSRNIGPMIYTLLAFAVTELERDIEATHTANIGVIEASESWGVKSGWDYE